MTDLVERLRDKRLMIDRQLREEAADEIESHRAALQLANSNVAEAIHQLNEAEAEIERLQSQLYHATVAVDGIREHALEEAANVADGYEPDLICPRGVAAAIRALRDNQ